MSETKIEWCDFTFNGWYGCQKVSPGCDNCFAESWAKRSGLVKWGPHADRRRASDNYWRKPLRWAKQARDLLTDRGERMLTELPRRPRVFCASLADVFDNQVPWEWRLDLFNLIMATPELDWLLLTKRPENIMRLRGVPMELPRNVWLGFTAEDQAHFDRRWPIMREIPAAVRFCSYEPAIGPLRLSEDVTGRLHWLICGGESGPGFRYMDLAWARQIERDCERAGIAFFMKQLAGKKPFPPEFKVVRQFPR